MPYDTPQSTSGDVNLEALISEAGQVEPIQDAPDSGDLSQPAAAAPSGAAPQAAPAKASYPEVEFTWNGKPVKAPWDKAKQWAQQGYDYSQRVQAFNKQQKEWETKLEAQKKEYEQKYNPYIEVDELAKQHPEQWQFIQEQLQKLKQNPQAFMQPSGAPNAELMALKQELNSLKEFKQSFEQHQNETVQKSHDDNLTQEIQSIREKHPNLDWDTYDENGMNLEKRVIDHALKNGISNFRAAFRDYNYDSLTKYEADRAKEAMAKETQKRTKLGLLGQSSTPKANSQSNRKPKNYNEAATMALEELGIA